MEAVAALPASDSPFVKTQTVGSLVYSIIVLTISTYQLDNSWKLADNERFTFSCKGVTEGYDKKQCLTDYNNGPNYIQSWLYYATLFGPLIIIIFMGVLMLRKKYTIQRNNCRVHIHQLYFLKVPLRLLFHLSVGVALLWSYMFGQLILEGTYACVIGNSTITCIDSKAKSKSIQNIVCCSLHWFLVLFSLLELVYYGYKWDCSEEDRNRLSSGSDQCGKCSYFIKTFNIFADYGNGNTSRTSDENIPLQPNSSLEGSSPVQVGLETHKSTATSYFEPLVDVVQVQHTPPNSRTLSQRHGSLELEDSVFTTFDMGLPSYHHVNPISPPPYTAYQVPNEAYSPPMTSRSTTSVCASPVTSSQDITANLSEDPRWSPTGQLASQSQTKIDTERKPVMRLEADNLKETYKKSDTKHEIHKVGQNNRIALEEVDVSDFAVRLKIGHCSQAEDNFRDERDRHLKTLKDVTGDAIDISKLIDKKRRVTFICGIAGMGKSVLAKQLTYGWANGDIYQDIKICVMFECRDLNYFKDRKGPKLQKHDILHEFLKSKVNYDLGDGEGVLVIVDGLDELYDITEKDSIIFGLLNIKGEYGMAKVIVTGRPHVEDKLAGYNNMGGLFKVEINGLSEDQIDEYVDKFLPNEDHKERVNKARTSSRGYLPIMYVPQFLNTLCCVAMLSKGEAVLNNTELYCWTFYLLLKQHADKQTGQDLSTISQVFKKYSNTLASLSELCYNLLKENKIIFKGNIDSKLEGTVEERTFIKSLFVDVKDNYTDKYQFKHLSLMEFLSALYICKLDMKNLLEIVKDNLCKGFIEVVSFVCRLLSGFSYEGIIKEMLKNVIGLKEGVNEKQLLHDVIELLYECGLNTQTKLSRSFEIITFFLNKNFNYNEFIKSIIKECHGDEFLSDELTTYNLCLIYRHLESCGWEEDDIRKAFKNVVFKRIIVSTIEQLDVVTVNQRFRIGSYGIVLCGMKTIVNAIQERFKEGDQNEYCGGVILEECEFMDDEVNGTYLNHRQLELLQIKRCQFKTMQSFLNVCHWGMSCEKLELQGLNIKSEWWERMVEIIEKRRVNGGLKIERLEIYYCTPDMSDALAMRIRYCGVHLEIEHSKMEIEIPHSLAQTEPSSSLTFPSTIIDLPSSAESPSRSKATGPSQVLPPSTMSTSLRMTSPKTAVDNTADHSTPPHSPSSGTPSHDVRTPSQYPAPPTSSSSPSVGRPTFQVPTDLTHTITRP